MEENQSDLLPNTSNLNLIPASNSEDKLVEEGDPGGSPLDSSTQKNSSLTEQVAPKIPEKNDNSLNDKNDEDPNKCDSDNLFEEDEVLDGESTTSEASGDSVKGKNSSPRPSTPAGITALNN